MKVNNKNKFRIDAIYAEIESNEEKTKVIQDKIAGLDYSKAKDASNPALKILTDAQKTLEDRLQALYQELETLES